MASLQFRPAALRVLPAVFGCLALVSAASEARSQAVTYQYAAKFLCGSVSGKTGTPGAGVVAPGTYFTSVNVHNYNGSQTAEIRKRFVVAPPNEATGGKMSDFFPFPLPANEASEIECANILNHFNPPLKGPVKGFVALVSDLPLDVVAVYTAAAPAPGSPVVTLFMERVPHE